MVGIQFGRFVRRLEEGKQFIFGWNAVRCVVLHLLADVVNDLPLDLGGQGVQQLLLALFKRTTDADRDRDCSLDMAVSYGLDCTSEEERREDYYSVRGLK